LDRICESLVELIQRDGGDRGLGIRRLVDSSGFARQTVHNHLKHLTASGIVSGEWVSHGRGRPEILYRVSRQALRISEWEAMVSLPFGRLKRVCRFEKGGWCKEARGECALDFCPLVVKK
jgi:hypothetical protein